MLGLGTLSSTLLYFPTNLESTLLQTSLFLFLVWDSETKPWVLLVFIPLLGWRCFWASRPHIRSLGCCFVGWVSCTLSD